MSLRATARIVATRTGLPVLTGEGPLAPRRTRATGPGSRVTLVGAMSAPLGGDRLTVEAEAREGAALTVDSAAATLALPGRVPAPAHYDVRLTVGEGAELRWLPEQTISAYGSELRLRTRAEVAPTALLVVREEQILGRYGEEPGTLSSRLTVHRAGRPLLDQETACGPGAPAGWDGPAGVAGHRALGQLLVVAPAFAEHPVTPLILGPTAVRTPLAGPAALVTAVAPDALALRLLLDEALRELLAEAAHGPRAPAAPAVAVHR
ncbi:urease accessory protein UreD [Streptomyces sp. NPDC093085]|uniref:urease accessory protein UreD n=1 Tax=Streptomyces sp. NPDC093085 TaxID=3155068 RepID=UPI00342B303F